ncbi:MAG: MATE family efflux transporter [Candidatus Pacebacteria bacterium]|nr:MATE family efflux transporter [Candidatus Paceibacterota bacterium]
MSEPPTQPTQQKRDLTQGPLLWTLFRMAAPMAVGMVLHNLYNIIDAFWLGRLSKEALGAPGVSMPFIFMAVSFGMGFGAAGTSLVAQHVGAKQYREADIAAGQLILVLSGLTIIFVVPIIIYADGLLELIQVPPEVVAQAGGYLRIFMIGLPLMSFHIAYSQVLRALGDTHTVVIVTGISNLINFILDPMLIFGIGPLPALEANGAAIASVVGATLTACISAWLLFVRGRAGLKLRLSDLKPRRKLLRHIFRIGLPGGANMSSNSLGFMAFQVMINSLGANVIGAFAIGFRITHFLSVPAHCMGMAAAPIVGQALGAGKPSLARKTILLALALFAALMVLPYVAVTLKGDTIARFFISDPGVTAEARRFFLIVPVSSFFFNMLMILTAVYIGSGHTRPLLIFSIFRQWILRLPLAWMLGFALAWGSLGIYTGMAISNVMAAILAWMMFRAKWWEEPVIHSTY